MRRGFKRSRKSGGFKLQLEPMELNILNDLVAQLLPLIEPMNPPDADPLAAMVGIEPNAMEPDDPALQRLFPAAYPDDDESSAEFRRFTERGLREGKAAHARVVLATLHRFEAGERDLTAEEAQAWLGTLNDLRLVLASRLGVDDDEGEWRARASGDPEFEQGMALYDWLTWLQDSLLDALIS